MFKGSIKRAIKLVEANIESGDKEAAQQSLSLVYKKLDKALAKGLFHKNNIARKKSRLSSLVNTL